MGNYNTETPIHRRQPTMAHLVRKIEDGHVKEAQEDGSAFIREKLREDGFTRQIMEPKVLTEDELDRDENTDQPKKVVDMEPGSTAATMSFKGSHDVKYFEGPKYAVYFDKIESEHFTKNKFELMTYDSDIRKILSDNCVKDMQEEEDSAFIGGIDAIINANPGQQDIDASASGFTPGTIVAGFSQLVSSKIPVGKLLMTESQYLKTLAFPATQVGDPVASGHYNEGAPTKTLFGVPVVTTVKNDIVQDGMMYVFAPEQFLGNFFMLQDATLYIKQEADMLTFWGYEAPGIGIGNTLGVVGIYFDASIVPPGAIVP